MAFSFSLLGLLLAFLLLLAFFVLKENQKAFAKGI
jgi:hypothetical protein